MNSEQRFWWKKKGSDATKKTDWYVHVLALNSLRMFQEILEVFLSWTAFKRNTGGDL